MRYFNILVLAALLVLPLGLHAGDTATKKEASATEYNTWSAKVVGIDSATHTLTLLNDLGERHKIQVDPNQVKNFSQIKEGDLVVLRTSESLALTLAKAKKGEKPSAGAGMAMDKASPGQKPRIGEAKVLEISAEVVHVDQAKQTVKLKGPEGNTVQVKVQDPSRLQGLKKGDLVAATYTESTAISVEPQPAK